MNSWGLVNENGTVPAFFVVPSPEINIVHPFWGLLTGFVATLTFFVLVWALPDTGIHPLLTMSLMAGLTVLVGLIVLKLLGNGLAWSNRYQFALASGALGFFILLAPLQELDKNRTDNNTEMAIVGLTIAVFLVWIARRTRHIDKGKMVVNST